MPVLVDALVFVVALLVLLKASDTFTAATAQIGLSFGVSPFIIGATVVAGGTSLPELVSSVIAVVRGAPAIVVGNAVGSNVANIFIVLGIAAVVGERIWIERELVRVDLPILVASTVFVLIAVWDSPFVWYEGLLGLALLAVYIHSTLSRPARLDDTVEELVEEHTGESLDADEAPPTEIEEAASGTRAGPRTYVLLLLSLVFVFLSADGLVRSIIGLAASFGIGTEIVAITAVGVGTSVPEIAVSVAAVRSGEPEIAVGNVLGSNVFNGLAVIGLPSLLTPLVIPTNVRTFAIPVMVLATLLYYFITQDREITRWEGGVLLVLYVVFFVNLLEFA
ncbi:calcium/sodium antiporter [Halolamina litorea]|uniref:Calcium/sodium antiporter n=1 Tax=Halolamina litorea TaxID=1515593 RepID=A0ABD6BUJ5_9EURY|nr:calcium/sodium antiporter [Halolamina litorea]